MSDSNSVIELKSRQNTFLETGYSITVDITSRFKDLNLNVTILPYCLLTINSRQQRYFSRFFSTELYSFHQSAGFGG